MHIIGGSINVQWQYNTTTTTLACSEISRHTINKNLRSEKQLKRTALLRVDSLESIE